MRAHRVRVLLMGGQACVFYGAAEFSRDADFAVLADAENLARLQKALTELRAETIAVPPFEIKFLRRGHAVHFRCRHPGAMQMRVDVMSKMRGVDSFAKLWKRRTTVQIPGGEKCDLLSLPDLVQAKKTQRDKDWPMIRRLVEAHYFENRAQAAMVQIKFWLRELRTAELLVEVVQKNGRLFRQLVSKRPLLKFALQNKFEKLERELVAEENSIRRQDRVYWQPLKKELEKLRRGR